MTHIKRITMKAAGADASRNFWDFRGRSFGLDGTLELFELAARANSASLGRSKLAA